jgi:hypothetical protein
MNSKNSFVKVDKVQKPKKYKNEDCSFAICFAVCVKEK